MRRICTTFLSFLALLTVPALSNATVKASGADPNVALYASVLPASRSVAVGEVATVFATLLNAGTSDASGCSVTPGSQFSGGFAFQRTDPLTNVPVGVPNATADIPGGGAASFVLSFVPDEVLPPTDIAPQFTCGDGSQAPTVTGLNTVLLSASQTRPPDLIALAATLSGDGVAMVEAHGGTFALATSNAGASGQLTASARVEPGSLPLTPSLCQTNPATGLCANPLTPGTSALASFGEGQTATFAAFLSASGDVPLDPARNRVIVEFRDGSGVVRGSTSVAVRTSNERYVGRAFVVGPLVGATVEVFNLTSATPLFSTVSVAHENLSESGSFDLPTAIFSPGSAYVLRVSGGSDVDANGDGVADPAASPFAGALYSVFVGSDLDEGPVSVNPLTHMAYRFVLPRLQFPAGLDSVLQGLDAAAQRTIRRDVGGDGLVDRRDLLGLSALPAPRQFKRDRSKLQNAISLLAGGFTIPPESVTDFLRFQHQLYVAEQFGFAGLSVTPNCLYTASRFHPNTGGGAVRCIDILSEEILSDVRLDTPPADISVLDEWVFSGGVAHDFSEPGLPVFRGGFSGHPVVRSGDLLFGRDGRIWHAPATPEPEPLSALELGHLGGEPLFSANGGLIWTLADGSVRVLDVSNPQAPLEIARYEDAVAAREGQWIYLYSSDGDLQLFDADGALQGAVRTVELAANGTRLHVEGQRVYLTVPGRVLIYDVLSGLAPVALASAYGEGQIHGAVQYELTPGVSNNPDYFLLQARDLAGAGQYPSTDIFQVLESGGAGMDQRDGILYVAADRRLHGYTENVDGQLTKLWTHESTLSVSGGVDVGATTIGFWNHAQAASMQLDSDGRPLGDQSLQFAGPVKAFAVTGVSSRFAVSSGDALGIPVLTNQLRNSVSGTDAVDLLSHQSLLLVAAAEEGLAVYCFDVADCPLGVFDTPGSAVDLAADGDLVYVADSGSGIRIVDISDPAEPVLAGVHAGVGESTARVAVAQDLLFALVDADGGRWLVAYDRSNRRSLREVLRVNLYFSGADRDWPEDLLIFGSHLLLKTNRGIYQTRLPTMPAFAQ